MVFPPLDGAAQAQRKCLRKALRTRRRALSLGERRTADSYINRRLAKLTRGAEHVAAYFAADGEPSLHTWLAYAPNLGVTVYLPVLTRANSLLFRQYRAGDRCRCNRFGIAEPLPRERSLEASQLDLLLMPLVGFDRSGGRLGMGGGYYDRALADLRRSTQLIGIAYHWQEIDALPLAQWDVRLHAVVTPREVIRCGQRPQTLPRAATH